MDCPFSNHQFVVTLVNIKPETRIENTIFARVLYQKRFEQIKNEIAKTPFDDIASIFYDVNDRWDCFKKLILEVVDSIAPYKKFRMKKNTMYHGLIVSYSLLFKRKTTCIR